MILQGVSRTAEDSKLSIKNAKPWKRLVYCGSGQDWWCPDGNMCCKMNWGWGCCRFSDGVCCRDGKHCCPNGFICPNDTCM